MEYRRVEEVEDEDHEESLLEQEISLDDDLEFHERLWQRIRQLEERMQRVEKEEDEETVEFDQLLNDADAKFPPTCVVIKFAASIRSRAVNWLVGKIECRRSMGGAGLMVRQEPTEEGKKVTLHVSATSVKLLEVAESMELRKNDVNGELRDFSIGELDLFLKPGHSIEQLFTGAEKQEMVLRELHNIRVLTSDDRKVPGHDNVILFPGQSIVDRLQSVNLIVDMFPLHEPRLLEDMEDKWYLLMFQVQPFNKLKEYFGSEVAIYFSFLGFYTTALLAPALLGLFCGLLQLFGVDSLSNVASICVFNMIWVTCFLELWKRKCSEQSFIWGTDVRTHIEEPRPGYYGDMTVDPVTGNYQPFYPFWKTQIKMYLVSYPLVFICLMMSAGIMLLSIWSREQLLKADSSWSILPSVLYAAVVVIINRAYHRLAHRLTEWENHRTQKDFQANQITKLVVFEFLNSFMSLFYIAFYLQDLVTLRHQLAVLLIFNQVVNNLQESVLPLFFQKTYHTMLYKFALNLPENSAFRNLLVPPKRPLRPALSEVTPSVIEPATTSAATVAVKLFLPQDSRIKEVEDNYKLEHYTDTFGDYLELFLQFGYVFLFSAVYPTAAIWAVLNNIIEIQGDAFKLRRLFRRTPVKHVKDIGVWQTAFEILGGIAVMTNCALLGMSPEMRELAPSLTDLQWMLLFLCLEHLVLAMKLGLAMVIPDQPEWVSIEKAKLKYRQMQALKREKLQKSRRQLSKRIKTVQIGDTGTSDMSDLRHRKIPA